MPAQRLISFLAVLTLIAGYLPVAQAGLILAHQATQEPDTETVLDDSKTSVDGFDIDPDLDALGLTRQGAKAMSAGKPGRAVALFEAAMKKDPDDAMIRNNLAFSLLKCSKPDPERALQLLEEGLASMPRGSNGYRSHFQDTRGTALMQLERFQDAIAAFELALIDRPENLEILNAIVKCYDQTELDSTGYVERIEELKNSAPENNDAEPKPDADKDEFLQAIESEDSDVVFNALIKANDWPRDAETSVRIAENRKRVQLADHLLSLNQRADNYRELAIDSKFEALAAIYGLDLFHNLGDKEIGKELREFCGQFVEDANDLVQRNARLGLLKYHVFEHIKGNADQEADAAKTELLEVLKRFPDDDVCLDTVRLILKSTERLKKSFQLQLIECLQSDVDQFEGTATKDFILEIETIESAQ